MQRFSRYVWWSAPFVMMMILLPVAFRQCATDQLPSGRPIGDWSIIELAEHLNLMGVNVRLRSTQDKGPIGQSAFLMFADRDWRSLNALKKDPNHIHEWRDVLFCERVGERDVSHLLDQWGDHCLTVGPFLFYGDTGLLHRVRTALTPFAPSAVS